eukprot:COSAG01_NODE_17716_length_1129_cov_2.769903_1_plen_231_part_10
MGHARKGTARHCANCLKPAPDTSPPSMFAGDVKPGSMEYSIDETMDLLRKFPSNKSCATCKMENQMFGFKNICVKYGVFICDGCKSAHQGISHRCKTIGQATFTAEDVALCILGNDHARKTWLGKLTRAQVCQMAPEGNPPATEWQAWIMKVYEQKVFYVDVPDYTPLDWKPAPKAADANRPLTAREKAEQRRAGKLSGGGRGVRRGQAPAPAPAAAVPAPAPPAAAPAPA